MRNFKLKNNNQLTVQGYCNLTVYDDNYYNYKHIYLSTEYPTQCSLLMNSNSNNSNNSNKLYNWINFILEGLNLI
jgi:hypothetical protein